MQVIVNGEPRETTPDATLATLLVELGLAAGTVVVERNGEIVPGERYGQTALEAGDRLEIVRFVGGG
ncbi:MAG: hypothetical protein Kow0092_39080 [Deferrisomatales bacterium]